MDDCCANCRFFVQDDSADDGGGECLRYPPVVVSSDGQEASLFPAVPPQWWCGEFSRRLVS